MREKVKVNFFQKSFDTKWRNILFNWYQGDYLKYLWNRYQWYNYPKKQKIASFPLHVDIETAATCNMRCPMCANRHITDEKFRKYGKMNFDLYKKIVDECVENNIFSIRLSWRGEVFTNSRFAEMVHYAKVVKKIPQVSFLTNGFKLNGENAKKMIEYGVDYISVSVDGLEEMYEKIRYPAKFNNIYNNLQDFKTLRKKMKKKKPLIRITTLWPAIAKDPKAYYNKMSIVADKIVYNPLKDYSITTQDREGFQVCQFIFERLFVGYDGNVHPCSNTKDEFIIGNAYKKTIKEMWNGVKLNNIRKKHINGNRLQISPCNTCSYGVDYEKRWINRDWTNWDPKELLPIK